MPQSPQSHIHALMCLRMAVECTTLAADVPEPELRARYLSLSRMWRQLSAEPRVLH